MCVVIHSSYLALDATIKISKIKMAAVRAIPGTVEPITANNYIRYMISVKLYRHDQIHIIVTYLQCVCCKYLWLLDQ